MKRRTIEKLKIPEAVRVPIMGGFVYKSLSKLENEAIAKAPLGGFMLNKGQRSLKVTASMTSFPARINFVHIALKSLLLQSYKPDRLVLWLAEEQFPGRKLPSELIGLIPHGLEIEWCEDLYGHKKYYYCLQGQRPDEVVITYDDDIIYPVDSVKRLVETHEKHPNCLVCERAQAIDYEPDGSLKNPGRWKTISDIGYNQPSYSLNPSPGGGCLIPYGAFCKDALDKEKIRSLAFKNDDLWYMFMAAANGTKTIKTKKYHKPFSLIEGSQIMQMATENILGNRNQAIMNDLALAYPEAYQRILGVLN